MMSRSLFTLGAAALSVLATAEASYLKYSTVPGYFLQDESTTVVDGFDYTAVNFGLIERSYDADATFDPTGTKTQWERFENQVVALNAAAAAGERYAVLYLGRHGEGYHNAAETFYGTPAWNCYWSELDGNGTVTWEDAHVTPNGVAQAQVAHDFWASQIANQKQSLPEAYYTSPLSRCLETAQITFGGLVTPFTPLIKELLREGISIHTCDHRSTKTEIAAAFPGWPFEAGFSEDDKLWNGITAETSTAQNERSYTVLGEIFSADPRTFFSFTSHSGEIASILSVIGHRDFSLATGAVIPVLVKVEQEGGDQPYTSIQPWQSQATCASPPITSLATGGCVCSSTTAATSATSAPSSVASASASATSVAAPTGASNSTASVSSAASYTTSIVYTTTVSTITKCPATVTDCPVGKVTTITVEAYTTICPVGSVPTVSAGAPGAPGAPFPSSNGTTAVAPQQPSSSVVPNEQPTGFASSGSSIKLGSGIAMIGGLAVVAFWL